MKKFLFLLGVLLLLSNVCFADHIRSDGNGGYWNGSNHVRFDGNGG